MRLREHVAKLHDHLHEHHRALAECHNAACEDEDQSDGQRNFHKAMRDCHTHMADKCKAMGEECRKSLDDVDLSKIIGDATDAALRAELIRKGFSQPRADAPKLVARAGETLPSEPLDPEVLEMFNPGVTR